MAVEIRQAQPAEAAVVEAMLVEAAQWVDALGEVMWDTGELSPERIAAETAAGQFVLAIADGEPAGAIRFQLEDTLFWPDLPPGTRRRSFIVSWSDVATRGRASRLRCCSGRSITRVRSAERICVSTVTSRARSCGRCMKASAFSFTASARSARTTLRGTSTRSRPGPVKAGHYVRDDSTAFTRSGVNGTSRMRAPVASKIALPIAAATTVIAVSPEPQASSSG